MRTLYLLICLLSLGHWCNAQPVTVNWDVDTSLFAIKEPLQVWLDLLQTKDDSAGAAYWNSAEVAELGQTSYFLAENDLQVGTDNYLRFLSYGNVHVLSVREENQYYRIKSMLSFEMNGKRDVWYIFSVYAGKENGEWKLFNPLPINTVQLFQSQNLGYVNFHFPKYLKFDEAKADSLNKFLLKLGKDFEVQPDTVDYYFAPTNREILELKGYEYFMAESGAEIPSGYADVENKTTYSSGLGEFYPHELVHIFLNKKYNMSHEWATEGLATWLGGSRGLPLEWHLSNTKSYLIGHSEVDLDTMLNFRNMDQYTGYKYALGGLVVKLINERYGLEGVKRFMNMAISKTEYYAAVEQLLGVRQRDLNEFLRKELREY